MFCASVRFISGFALCCLFTCGGLLIIVCLFVVVVVGLIALDLGYVGVVYLMLLKC